MAMYNIEVKTCDKCQSYVEPMRPNGKHRCYITGLPVCSKEFGCYFYKRHPRYSLTFVPEPPLPR